MKTQGNDGVGSNSTDHNWFLIWINWYWWSDGVSRHEQLANQHRAEASQHEQQASQRMGEARQREGVARQSGPRWEWRAGERRGSGGGPAVTPAVAGQYLLRNKPTTHQQLQHGLHLDISQVKLVLSLQHSLFISSHLQGVVLHRNTAGLPKV